MFGDESIACVLPKGSLLISRMGGGEKAILLTLAGLYVIASTRPTARLFRAAVSSNWYHVHNYFFAFRKQTEKEAYANQTDQFHFACIFASDPFPPGRASRIASGGKT